MIKTKILIVEDNAIVAEDLKTKLISLGYEVTAIAYSGEKALSCAKDQKPDIALMDIRLGDGMNGIDTALELKNKYNISVIYLTAHADDDTISRAKLTEPYGYIVKPFDENELKSTIEIAVYKKKSDLKIKESQQWLKTTLSSIGDGVITTDSNGNISFMNPVAVQLSGWSEDEVMGKPLEEIFQIINQRTRETVENPVSKVIQDGVVVGLANHTLLITKDGKELPIADSGAPIKNEKGEIIGVVLVFRDQIKERAAEKELRQSEKKYRSMMESLTDQLYICSPEFTVEYMNPAMIKRLGRDAVGETCHKALHGLDHQCDWCVFHKVAKGETVETNITSPLDGRHYRVTNMPIRNKNGTISKMTINKDITEYLEAVSEKEKVQAQLLQSQKMESIGTLAGGIAHDFNNILSSIIGFTELAIKDLENDTVQGDDLQEIYSAGLRAKELVKQILVFARRSDEDPKPIKPSKIAREVLKLIRASIPSNIEIKQKIATESVVIGIPSQIHQIFMNLFTNAAQAMEERGGIIDISLRDVFIDHINFVGIQGLQTGNYIEIKISDTGMGISLKDIESIFEPYFTTKPQGEGTGLGLAVVHGIVENYGGKIKAESILGKCTTITIYLPAIKKIAVEKPIKSKGLPRGEESILLVDDEPSIIKMGSRILESLGYNVRISTSSIEALDLFKSRSQEFDLVITDATMPEMTGDQLAVELMTIRADIPVILCTGYNKKITEEMAAKIGIKAFTVKPLITEDLADIVRKVLDDARGRCRN